MREKVVYLLGAGFSATLGLPVMNNFLTKSKDMYFKNPEKFDYCKEVFRTINELSTIKNYFYSDLYNIEEIFSILEMDKKFGGKDLTKIFKEYINDVISFFTPELEPVTSYPANWETSFLGRERICRYYACFVSHLFNLSFSIHGSKQSERKPVIRRNDDQEISYSIITFNYDLVIENVIKFFKQNMDCEIDLSFIKNLSTNDDLTYASVPIAKLHGSIDEDNIIPPTWNKDLGDEIIEAWKLAHRLISEANYLRIIGYSLPITDSYMNFFLKSAIKNAQHLKRIDVLCLDSDSENVKNRYEGLIDFNFFVYKNSDALKYLEVLYKNFISHKRTGEILIANWLESTHVGFFENKE